MSTDSPTPSSDFDPAKLSADPQDRHEQLVDLFGQFVMWMRQAALDSAKKFTESVETRSRLSALFRTPYEQASTLSIDDQKKAFALSEAAVDAFVKLFLGTLAHKGNDFPLANDHAIRFRVEMEIVDIPTNEMCGGR